MTTKSRKRIGSLVVAVAACAAMAAAGAVASLKRATPVEEVAVVQSIGALSCAAAELCREGGTLLHEPNSAGRRVWTTSCGPNTLPRATDPVCRSITNCSGSGGFGRFLKAVTGDCRSKSFSGYFGLDGMTFGILDWTSDNLPVVLERYRRRDPAGFAALATDARIPLQGGCVRPNWACKANRTGRLMCDAGFREPFRSAISRPSFQKAEVDYALELYERRLKRFADLGLKTEYGNIAMAVVANNLKRSPACRPAAWKTACSRLPDERSMIQCMLREYVAHECRGSRRGSVERVSQIEAVFADGQAGSKLHPSADEVLACVPKLPSAPAAAVR